MPKSLRITQYVLLLLLASCSSIAPTPAPTATLPPVVIPTLTPIPTITPSPSPTPIPVPQLAKYTLNTTINYDAHTVSVDETILYPNQSGQILNALVLAVVPNLWDGSFALTSISIDGAPITTYILKAQRLDVTLPSAFMPNAALKINIVYTLNLPFAEQEDPSISRPRIYGYTTRQINLANWYPFVVPFINGGWVLHDPWFYGEHLVYDPADYEVNLKFTDPATAPVVASSGFPEPQTGFTRYTISTARAFALSASRDFKETSTQVGDVTVYSYYYPFYEASGVAALKTTILAMQLYSNKFGAYPHKTMSVVMADFSDSMEFSAFFFHSYNFYNLYDNSQNNHLVSVAAHETAHQWWFEQVGNDQAAQPWLDESLATYSERIYYENVAPDSLMNWWWPIRINFHQPGGFVDNPTNTSGQTEPQYLSAVYFNGAQFLEDLRARIGDEAFFAFLKDYFDQGRGRIMTASDFFRILAPHTSTDYSDLIRKYFQNTY